MSITMKSLKDFRGRPGEGKDRMVEAGSEFNVEQQGRADDLERRGFAVPVVAKAELKPKAKMEQRPLNKMEPAPENKAADTGPLASPGGRIGEQSGFASLSPPDQVQPRRGSRRRGGMPK